MKSLSSGTTNFTRIKVHTIPAPITTLTIVSVLIVLLRLLDCRLQPLHFSKTIIPFATSGGSSIDDACEDLTKAYPDINWKDGRLLNETTEEELKQWVESL